MILLTLGYFAMGLIFPVLRFFYRVLLKKSSQNSLIHAVKEDFLILFAYVKQIVVSNPKKFKFIVVLMIGLIILPRTPLQMEIAFAAEDFLSAMIFFVFVTVFAPQDNPSSKGFPVEIFGFIYSIIFMYYSAGTPVFDVFYSSDSSNDMWIYGYIVTMFYQGIFIASQSQKFMEM